jgi:hypothetical protein
MQNSIGKIKAVSLSGVVYIHHVGGQEINALSIIAVYFFALRRQNRQQRYVEG